jgi:mRNA-degrading endonuclease RelE of RelBE toxin-antitoxin system
VPRSVHRVVARLPKHDRQTIYDALHEMESDPFSGDVRRLAPAIPPTYRRRLGSYRVVFIVETTLHTVAVLNARRRTTTTYRKRK